MAALPEVSVGGTGSQRLTLGDLRRLAAMAEGMTLDPGAELLAQTDWRGRVRKLAVRATKPPASQANGAAP